MHTSAARALFVFAGISLAWSPVSIRGQTRMDFFEATAAREQTQSRPDTAMTMAISSFPDSARPHWFAGLDAGYHTPPVHPYFRDEYRVIQDMRRLLLFVDPYAIHDLTSVPEMFAIARSMPEAKQAQIIGAALAGSVANQVSEMVSRSLRQRQAGYVQWQLEKIVVRTSFRRFYTHWYYGLNMQGFSLHAPVRGLSFSYHTTKAYLHEGVNYWPTRSFGFHYGRLNGKPIYGPRFASPLGSLALNYETEHRILLAGFELRRHTKVIVRLIYTNYLKLAPADFLRSEVILRW
ncbi:MAG: hypothetical protein ACREOO_22715 [bacterium]